MLFEGDRADDWSGARAPAPSSEGGAFPAAAGRPLAGDKSDWRTPCSASEVALLDTRQLGAPDLFSRQRPLKVPSGSTKKSTTKPAYSSRFHQSEASSNVTEAFCYQKSLISTHSGFLEH